jgi:hypothetical protein
MFNPVGYPAGYRIWKVSGVRKFVLGSARRHPKREHDIAVTGAYFILCEVNRISVFFIMLSNNNTGHFSNI